MIMKTIFSALLLIFVSCTLNTDKRQNNQDADRMTYIFDMVFNNPGEAPTITKYKNPVFLKETGYNGMVPHRHLFTSLMPFKLTPKVYREILSTD